MPIRVETRSGDTSTARKARQRVRPPDMLLTTPEQITLLLSHPDAAYLFGDLDTVILDELHALAPTKRGDLLALDLARLATLAPKQVRIGLSATVARPSELCAYLVPQPAAAPRTWPISSRCAAARRTTSACWRRRPSCRGPATARATRSRRSTPPSRPTGCR